LVVDARGLPLVFEVTEGQRHDSRAASILVQRANSTCFLADKAYDSDAFRAALEQRGCLPVIPSKASRAPSSLKHTGLAYRDGVVVSFGDSHTSYQSNDALA
jgi:transposase